MALGLRWRVALGAALAYFPATVWPVGPFVLTEYPEVIRSVDANRWWAWSLVLASLALLVGVAALVADRLDRPSGPPVGSPGAPVDRRPPATTELLAASGAVLVLVVSWFLRRADAVYPSGEVSTGTLLYRDWPETGDGIVLVASIFGALITVAALAWVLGAPASRPGAAARRAEVWFGAATGLALDLLVRALSFGNLVRPELYGDAPATFEVPTSSVSLPGLVLVVVAASALGVAGWTAAQRSGSGGSTPVDATT